MTGTCRYCKKNKTVIQKVGYKLNGKEVHFLVCKKCEKDIWTDLLDKWKKNK
jgi:hypothetical protein